MATVVDAGTIRFKQPAVSLDVTPPPDCNSGSYTYFVRVYGADKVLLDTVKWPSEPGLPVSFRIIDKALVINDPEPSGPGEEGVAMTETDTAARVFEDAMLMLAPIIREDCALMRRRESRANQSHRLGYYPELAKQLGLNSFAKKLNERLAKLAERKSTGGSALADLTIMVDVYTYQGIVFMTVKRVRQPMAS